MPIRKPLITVIPKELHILDMKAFRGDSRTITIIPEFYDCEIKVSAFVITRMLQWLVREHYIEVNGTLTLKIRNRRVRVYG